MHTFKLVLWTAVAWVPMSSLHRDRLHARVTLGQYWAGSVWAHTLVLHTTGGEAPLNEYRVSWAGKGLWRAVAGHSGAEYKHCREGGAGI